MVAVSRCARGFTLVEIMVVVSIMAVILTMGIPPFVRAVRKEGMRKAESDLLEACQKARAGAIINAKPQDLIFRPLDGSFEAPGAFPNTLLPEGVSIESITLNDFERGEGDDNAVVVRFFPKGNSDDFRIVIRDNNNGSHCAVWLDPVTALADISTE